MAVEHLLRRCLRAERAYGKPFRSQQDNTHFVFPGFVGVVRLPTTVADELDFLCEGLSSL